MFCLPLLQTAVKERRAPTVTEIVEREVSACCRQPGVVTVEHDACIVADAQTLEEFLKVSDRRQSTQPATMVAKRWTAGPTRLGIAMRRSSAPR